MTQADDTTVQAPPPAPPAPAPGPAELSGPPVPPAPAPEPAELSGPAEPPTPAPEAPAAPRPPRRALRALVRWTSVLLVFAAFGGAAAYAVTQPQRTRIPGLKTPGDGRWAYPTPTLPELPSGSPRPLADSNAAGRHYADIRSLLVPMPQGAVKDGTVPGDSGWMAPEDFVTRLQGDRSELALDLKDGGLRHIAAERWGMPDHTNTAVYLLQFTSAAYVSTGASVASDLPSGAESPTSDMSVMSPSLPSTVMISAYGQSYRAKPSREAIRYAWIESGDTAALVIQFSAGAAAVPEVPFRQTVRLQAQLLG